MINPSNQPVDVEEMRLWANGYRDMHTPPLPWEKFGRECEIPAGTLQPFCRGTYQGDNDKLAIKIFRFMQTVENRAHRQQSIPTDPGFFETETSVRIESLLTVAHMGRITIGATGPGTGKTVTAQEYAQKARPVWIATMRPSTNSLIAMMMEVQRALGMEPRFQRPAGLSQDIMDRVRGKKGLLVVEEANFLEVESIEEIRSWHDLTGVGVCFLGNEELLQRIESGRHRDRFARLNRRIANRHVSRLPTPADVRAFCDAWGLVDPAIRTFLQKIALTPDAGGLGECKQLIEGAAMLASSEGRGVSIADLRDVQMDRATRWIKA